MKYLLEVCLVTLTVVASGAQSFAADPHPASPTDSFAGIWDGEMNGLPGVQLRLQQTENTISGTIVFYLQKRADSSAPWHVEGNAAVPLLSPHVQGKTLTFEVQHHKCHGCSELGPNVRFRMQLVASNEARLWKLDEVSSGSGLQLMRTTDATASTEPRQEGISVELPIASHATTVPAADKPDALIVTITANGEVYLGLDRLGLGELTQAIERRMVTHDKAMLYIKADSRSPYDSLMKVLDAAESARVHSLALLTAQKEPHATDVVVPPRGFELMLSK